MPLYRVGTISLTKDSRTVIGQGTEFGVETMPGDVLILSEGEWVSHCFEIKSIESDTRLTLDIASPETVEEAQYVILRSVSTANNLYLMRKIEEFLKDRQVSVSEFRTWVTGPEDGGPENDGRYPLTDRFGHTHMVLSPAAMLNLAAGGGLLKSENLGDLIDRKLARENLGLGTASLYDINEERYGKVEGKVTRSGDYGLGAVEVDSVRYTINYAEVTGFYKALDEEFGHKKPYNESAVLHISTNKDKNRLRPDAGQLFIETEGNENERTIYFRSRNKDSWSNLLEITHSGNIRNELGDSSRHAISQQVVTRKLEEHEQELSGKLEAQANLEDLQNVEKAHKALRLRQGAFKDVVDSAIDTSGRGKLVTQEWMGLGADLVRHSLDANDELTRTNFHKVSGVTENRPEGSTVWTAITQGYGLRDDHTTLLLGVNQDKIMWRRKRGGKYSDWLEVIHSANVKDNLRESSKMPISQRTVREAVEHLERILEGKLSKDKNLADLEDSQKARKNLGLGTAATEDIVRGEDDVEGGGKLVTQDWAWNNVKAPEVEPESKEELIERIGFKTGAFREILTEGQETVTGSLITDEWMEKEVGDKLHTLEDTRKIENLRNLAINQTPWTSNDFPTSIEDELGHNYCRAPAINLRQYATDTAECIILPAEEYGNNFTHTNTPWMKMEDGRNMRVIPVDIRTNFYNTPVGYPLFKPVEVNGYGMLTYKYIGDRPIHTILKGSIHFIVRHRSRLTKYENYGNHLLALSSFNHPHLEDGQNRGRRGLGASMGGFKRQFIITEYNEFNDLCFPIDQAAINNANTWGELYRGSEKGFVSANYNENDEALALEDQNGPVNDNVRTTKWMDVENHVLAGRRFLMNFEGESSRSRVQCKDKDGKIWMYKKFSGEFSSRRIYRLPMNTKYVRIYYSSRNDTVKEETISFRPMGAVTSQNYDPLGGVWSEHSISTVRDVVFWPGTTYCLNFITGGQGGNTAFRSWGYRVMSGGFHFTFDAGHLRESLASTLWVK